MPRWLTFGGVLRVLAVGFDIAVRWTAGLILTGARCFRAVPGELDSRWTARTPSSQVVTSSRGSSVAMGRDQVVCPVEGLLFTIARLIVVGVGLGLLLRRWGRVWGRGRIDGGRRGPADFRWPVPR